MSISNGFTQNADLYRISPAHAELEDLILGLEERSLFGLSCLDVATGSGHTAFYLAEKQAHVFAVDPNEAMLKVAQEESDRKSLSIRFLKSSAEDLPFDDDTFDLVTCRLAAHHFDNVLDFLTEVVRVLKPGGHFLVVDNVLPEDLEAARWLDDFERRRDPSHQHCYSAAEWQQMLSEKNFELESSQEMRKELDFTAWVERMSLNEQEGEALWQELLQSPQGILDFCRPRSLEGKRFFSLQRQIFLARLSLR